MINETHAMAYCIDDISEIENYTEAIMDNTQTWVCHHRGEILPCGTYSVEEMKKYGLYFHRPANELIFLTPDAHSALHAKNRTSTTKRKLSESKLGEKNPMFGRRKTESERKRISERLSGKNHPMYGKKHSAESRAKMSKSKIGKQPKNLEKMIESVKGSHWYNDGTHNVRGKVCPKGFKRGRINMR